MRFPGSNVLCCAPTGDARCVELHACACACLARFLLQGDPSQELVRLCFVGMHTCFAVLHRALSPRLLHRGIYPLQPLLCNSPGFILSGVCQNLYLYLYDNGLVGQNRRAADD